MLILKRNVGESFYIGADIMVMVTMVDMNGTVKLGIVAPNDVKILRSELAKEGFDISVNSFPCPPPKN
jgi:carbon storage regulator CsrA